MRKIWLLAVVAALLTTACRIETNILIGLNADGSGSFGFEIGMDEEFRQLLAEQGEGFALDDFSSGFAGLPSATTSERQEGDMMFSVVTVDFADAAEFQEVIAAGGEEGTDIDVVWTEDEVVITATLEGTGGLGDLGGADDDQSGVGDFDLGAGLEGFATSFFSGSVIVDMPGDVKDHNADSVLPDGRLQWDLKLDGSNVEIRAVSSLSEGGGFPAWLIAVLVLAALAAIAWLSARRKRTTAVAAVESAGATVGDGPAVAVAWDNSGTGSMPPDAESAGSDPNAQIAD